jgi:hypothetical protein
MIGRALDKNNDLIISSQGSLALVSEGAEVLQHVRSRLQFYMEEWFLDLQAGTPYFQLIFTKPANLANMESIFKSRIIGTPGVSSLLEFSMDYEGGAVRRLSIQFSAETDYGVIKNEKVTING